MSQVIDRDTLPLLAPLSESITAFLLDVYKKRHGSMSEARLALITLEPALRRFREAVYHRLAPSVKQGLLKTKLVQQAIMELTPTET